MAAGGGVTTGEIKICIEHEDVLGSLLFCHILVRLD